MKLISINIEMDRHRDTILPFLAKEKPDVLCFQELLEKDFEFYKTYMEQYELSALFQPWSYIKEKKFKDLYGQRQGIAVFAKKIIRSGTLFFEGKAENVERPFEEYISREEGSQNKALIWADIEDETAQEFRVVTSHLPVTEKGSTTPYQIETMKSFVKALESLDECVFTGDTNAPRGKEAFALLAEKYKDNIPLEYETSIDQNLHEVQGIMYMVDGLFTTPSYVASNVRLVDGVSDHMAIVADIEKV